MVSGNLNLAPPVRIVDGLTAVPIDIQQLDSHVVFDAATSQAQVEASMRFIMGNTDGNPVFDFRQDIQEAYLNDVSVPVDKLQHHDFGGGPNAELRILDTIVPANSENTLRLIYGLNQPQAPNSQPIGWDPNSTRLYWDLWFTDLLPARYLEMWFPSNLIYDQFKFNLEIEIINSEFEHVIIANGSVNNLAPNHWRVEFRERFTSLSPMLITAAADRIESRQGLMILPDTSMELRLDTFKLTSTLANLASVENDVRTYITNNVINIGPYVHGDRFTTFIWTGVRSMEYEGGVTSNTGALEHEVFHSWFARGLRPATQNDSWLDEGWTVYNTGANRFALTPFDMSEPPVTLSSSNPFNRTTPSAAYSAGSRFFAGLADVLGLANLRSYMSSFFKENQGRLVTTRQLEAYLICRSGIVEIADYFERFVYGFPLERSTGCDLRLTNLWSQQDDSSIRGWEPVEAGQDNWFYAQITNAGATEARVSVVTFSFKSPFSTPVYPTDFRDNIINATVEFNLAPGATRTVKARWHKELIPPIPTGAERRHGCIFAEVDMLPDETADFFFTMSNYYIAKEEPVRLEVVRPSKWEDIEISFHHHDRRVVKELWQRMKVIESKALKPLEEVIGYQTQMKVLQPTKIAVGPRDEQLILNLARSSSLVVPDRPTEGIMAGIDEEFVRRDADLIELVDRAYLKLRPGHRVGLPYVMKPRDRVTMNVKIRAPKDAKPGDQFTIEVVQRDTKGESIGGFDVQVNIVNKR